MQMPNKPSLLNKLQGMASRLGESARKALHKSNTAKKDAAVKVAQFEKGAKATIKEAKTVAKGSTAGAAPAKKAAAKKVATKQAAVKKVPTPAAAPVKKAAEKKGTTKKVSAKKVSAKKASTKTAG